ncbi:MAG TPA: cysteine hydrolase family protein [Thermoleophilaceae bacterium]|jgi:nicotinamidase-related amidase
MPNPLTDDKRTALILVDVQTGLDDHEYWGERNNERCEDNIGALLAAWREAGRPVVFVKHNSVTPGSPLAAELPGNAFKDVIEGEPDLLVTKEVNSAFYGTPDLHEWLRQNDIGELVIAGITTNHCCESTARMAANLGYRTIFALDATHTFDATTPDGELVSAADLTRATAASLHGEFATVVDTAELLG